VLQTVDGRCKSCLATEKQIKNTAKLSGCDDLTSKEGRHNQLSLSPFIINEDCLCAVLTLSTVKMQGRGELVNKPSFSCENCLPQNSLFHKG